MNENPPNNWKCPECNGLLDIIEDDEGKEYLACFTCLWKSGMIG